MIIFFLTSFTIFLILSCSLKTDFFVLNSSKNSLLINFKYPVDFTKTTPYLEKLKRENPELYEKIKRTPCKFEKEIKNGWFPMIYDIVDESEEDEIIERKINDTGALNYCPYCGNPVKESFSFCPKCGKKIK